jgi:hypothetical protein
MLVASLLFACSGPVDADSGAIEELEEVCGEIASVDDLASCVSERGAESAEGYAPPTPRQWKDWRSMVDDIMSRGCDPERPPIELDGRYRVAALESAVGETVCAVYEALEANADGRLDLGWGFFVVRSDAEWNVDLQVPHPFDDLRTLDQGLELFSKLPLRTLLVAATHRDAGTTDSTCQSDYPASDPSHNVDNVFAAASEALALDTEGVVQLHGMADDSCPDTDVFVTEGVNAPLGAGSLAARIQTAIQRLTPWRAHSPEDSTCDLRGTTDVPGRILNGVRSDDACDDGADAASGLFVHLEQTLEVRDSTAWPAVLGDALADL